MCEAIKKRNYDQFYYAELITNPEYLLTGAFYLPVQLSFFSLFFNYNILLLL
jgi:hypothetical protein